MNVNTPIHGFFLAGLLALANAHASTLIVTSPGDSGPGTLRAALVSASDGDTIDLTGITGALDLTSGELLVSKSVSIVGPGTTQLEVIGNRTARLFHIAPGRTVTIRDLDICCGQADLGGAILNDHADLTLSSAQVAVNSALNGGAIYNDGSGPGGHASLRIEFCKFTSNTSNCDPCEWVGGAIYNSAIGGGSSSLELANSTIEGNSALNSGGPRDAGGIFGNADAGGVAAVKVINSTIAANSGGTGAAVASRNGELSLVNSTISGNKGGPDIFSLNTHLVILNSTVFTTHLNEEDSAIKSVGDGGASLVEIGSTICFSYYGFLQSIGTSSAHSLGYNLSVRAEPWLNGVGDQAGVAPNLGTLQDNGGPTWTMMPVAHSPAIDRGKNLSGAATDQRGTGFGRTVDSYFVANAADGTDVGAVEVPAATGPGMQKQIPPEEYDVLVDFYTHTQGDGWGDRTGWLDPNAPTWVGVTVSGFTYDTVTGDVITVGTVTELQFRGNGLSGTLPDSLGQLRNLELLLLAYNALSGSIPAGLGEATALQIVNLSNCRLSGSIPESLGNLVNLIALDLSNEWWGPGLPFPGNQLTGQIPASFGNLVKLQTLALSKNHLTGTIPDSFGNMTSLTDLYMSDNQLSGSIPESFGNLTNLRTAYLYFNQLSGTIPESFGKLVNLQELRMYMNQLSGGIPASLGKLAHLHNLTLSGNQLSGSIPSALGSLVNLTELALSGNQLSGAIPETLGNLVNLTDLGLAGNQLSGSIPATLGNIRPLAYLILSDNELSGSIPDTLGNIELFRLDLSNNQLSGSIPATLGNLQHLYQGLFLDHNQLTGNIPESLGTAGTFSLDLSHNQLTGPIPIGLGNLIGAYGIALSDNQLTGTIPDSLAALTQLSSLDVSANRLTGNLPATWGSSLGRLDLEMNCYDISPGSQPRAVIDGLIQRGVAVSDEPQRDDCQPTAVGDFNGDGCVDRSDLTLIMAAIRSHSQSLVYDLNGDGKVDVADARSLVLRFSKPDGSPCSP